MKTTRELLQQAESLPIEDRALLVDALLQSLNPIDPDIEHKWAEIAKRRLADIQSGNAHGIDADTVFDKARGLIES